VCCSIVQCTRNKKCSLTCGFDRISLGSVFVIAFVYIYISERAGHGRQLARELDVSKYDALLVVSGDGLICEVLNGFLERSDYKLALKMPIGHIPGGTSNGLAGAICYQCK
jgi:diacylglycerol kinase family enzyme